MSEFEKMVRQHLPISEKSKGKQEKLKNNTEFYKEAEEKITLPWSVYNSSLITGRDSYQQTFKDLVPGDYGDIREYIEAVLAKKRGKALALDIGGVGSTVFSEFSPGFFEKTAGACLKDTRKRYRIDTGKDNECHHSVIEGDILDKKTKKQIAEWTEGKKIDLVLERMAGGLELFSSDPRWVHSAIQEIYNLTSEDALIFLQLSYENKEGCTLLDPKKIESWVRKIRELFPNSLEVAWVDGSEKWSDGAAIRILKLPGAPEKLPSFS